ncbi:helix-turn-helix domain-containing protein [Tissierella carlieri]|uniref:Helix-turn-helix domain-containing protein n=1 Tax=Tissierella carlieri TaxID=689904 RepID=A0ABT1SEY3_9FIRM|nr:helix-turn-helix domain-containing protein [Tissierella carlieri]
MRKDLGMNQEEFCSKLNYEITRSNLSKIELGKIAAFAEFIKNVIEIYKKIA